MFRGLQTGRVDDKHRLKFSAQVRKKLEESYQDASVFITSLDGREVKVFPLTEWELVEKRLSEKSTEGADSDGVVKNKIMFQANRFGAEESLDNQGRILVPTPLREGVGMRGEVKILWQSNHMVVMGAERFSEKSVEQALGAAELTYAQNLGL